MKRVLILMLLFSTSLGFAHADFGHGDNDDKKGTAKVSWYGSKFHGRLTASGEVFDQNGLTAAHKTLPFGTKVRITNPSNGQAVVVTINDRGPYVGSRKFDLSKGAFDAISNTNHGVITIDYEVLDEE